MLKKCIVFYLISVVMLGAHFTTILTKDPMNIAYRTATIQDVDILSNMRFSCQKESAQYAACTPEEFLVASTQYFENLLTTHSGICWLAFDGDKPIGHLVVQILRVAPRLEKPNVYFGYIASVYTHPDYRKQGIGTQLMNLIIEWARENYNMRSLILCANPSAVPFYERMGFTKDQHYPFMEYLFLEHYK